MRSTILLSLVLSVGAAPGAASTLTWLFPDFAPYYIVSGPWAGQGTHDERLRLLQATMPGWDHRSVAAPSARINRELTGGRLVCSLARTRTPEREAVFHFASIPSTLAFPIGLAVRGESVGDYPAEPSLEEVFSENPSRTIGVAAGRSYGPEIDAVLEPFRGTGRLEERAAGDIYGGLVRMLAAGRIDGVLGFPPEFAFAGRQQGVEDRLEHLPLRENGAFAVGYPVCADSPEGRAAMRGIEEGLRVLRGQDAWREAAERWLPASVLPRFREAYERLLLGAE